MSEHTTIEHYVNHVMDEITKRDVEQVSEKLRALGWEEVVRCRDCRLQDEFKYCERLGFKVGDYGYCAWPIRKD